MVVHKDAPQTGDSLGDCVASLVLKKTIQGQWLLELFKKKFLCWDQTVFYAGHSNHNAKPH